MKLPTAILCSALNVLFSANYSMLNIALPLAISFFTFQQIAFLVDSYKGDVFQSNFLNYIVFVTFFPQLIAGPIVHHKEMMPQYSKIANKNVNYKNIYLGIFIFSVGLFKKTVIADNFSVWTSIGFDSLETLRIIEAWITSLSYTFQLYFDFSGYVDMAIGVALLFNIKLPINFNSPYKSTNIRDFWRRWHITLSRFLRDYLYIPFGGNKKGNARLYGNLFATFIIGGLWHGAGWTFIFWGFLHAISIIIHRIWHGFGLRLNKYFAWFITFNFINITWVFFRAENWEDAIKVIRGMFGFSGVEFSNFSENFFEDIFVNFYGDSEISIWIRIAFILCLFFKNSNQIISSLGLNNKNVMFVVFILIISLMNLENNAEFIYFNF